MISVGSRRGVPMGGLFPARSERSARGNPWRVPRSSSSRSDCRELR